MDLLKRLLDPQPTVTDDVLGTNLTPMEAAAQGVERVAEAMDRDDPNPAHPVGTALRQVAVAIRSGVRNAKQAQGLLELVHAMENGALGIAVTLDPADPRWSGVDEIIKHTAALRLAALRVVPKPSRLITPGR